MQPSVLPTGTITFLFTDIVGSTRLWENHTEAMRQALFRHDALLHEAIARHNGYVFKTLGDAFCASFANAREAALAACDAQLALMTEDWGEIGCLKARMAIHTGVADCRNQDYSGPALNRIARMLLLGHGDQILLSLAAYEQVVSSLPETFGLKDLGTHQLRDLRQPEHLFQLLHPRLPEAFPPLFSIRATPNNLPQQLTAFIGRETELVEIRTLLAKSRLVTLTGMGGTGKTRLALHLGVDLLEEYADGVWLVELAALSDPNHLPQAVVTALGLREEPGRPLLQTLADYLREKSALILLDNCEHLAAACAHLADALLRACPRVRLLATSREALGLAGEVLYRVGPLSIPDKGALAAMEAATEGVWPSLLRYDSVRLFCDRATAFSPAFAVTSRNAPALAQVCRRLDGIPLAIELAAARIRSLSVEQIAARLDDRFDLLTGGSRAAMPRQQTLRALIDWSYELLSDPERVVLQRLSVFMGGWTLEAAEFICADSPGGGGNRPSGSNLNHFDSLNLMTQLVDKSLVLYEEDDEGNARYRMLETVREYARERLEQSGEPEAICQRHTAYFAELAAEAIPKMHGPEQVAWYERIEAEHDNLRTAIERALRPDGEIGAAMRIVEGMKLFWCIRGYFAEGRNYAERALALGADAPAAWRIRAMNASGVLAWFQTDYAHLRQRCEEAADLARATDDRWGLTAATILLGSGAASENDKERARQLLDEGRTLARETGDTWLIGQSLHHAAMFAFHEGESGRAQGLAQGALKVARQNGDAWTTALAIRTLAFVSLARGEVVQARTSLQEAIRLYRRLRYKWGIATCFEGLARVARMEEQWERSASLYGAAASLREATGAPLPPYARGLYEGDVTVVREALQPEPFTTAWTAGHAFPLEQAIAYALEA